MSKQHELIGKILDKGKGKVYNKKSAYYGNTYLRLAVKLENKKEVREILVFQDSKVWQEIQRVDYLGKRYIFYCSALISNYQIVSYQLVDWKELRNYGSN